MNTITAEEFAAILPNLDAKSVVVDVREAEEYAEKHIVNSINLPLSNIGVSLPKLKEFKTIYVICESGGRSRYACEALKTADIDTINIANGLQAVKRAGVTLVGANG